MKIVTFSPNFQPTDEFLEFLKSIGIDWNTSLPVDDIMFNEQIIEYIEEHKSWENRVSIIGKKSLREKAGYRGTISVLDVEDASKPWTVIYTNGMPTVRYPVTIMGKNNYCQVMFSRKPSL